MQITQIIIRIVIAVYLIIMGVIDIRKQQIPLLPGLICLGVATASLLVAGIGLLEIAAGVLVGGLLLIVSRVSRGGVGEADALVYAVTGTTLGFFGNCEVLLISLMMAAIVGSVLMIAKHVGRKYRLPFVPFTLIAYGMVVCL